jgi:hypothetical protein
VTEAEWLACSDPRLMLDHLRDSNLFSERKARLFAAACGRNVWTWMADERSRAAVEVCEQYADGRVGQKALKAARRNAFTASKSPTSNTLYPGHAAASHYAAVVALNVCINTRRHGCCEMANATAGCANSLVFHVLGDTAGWADRKAQCDILRDIVGTSFRLVAISPAVLTWHDTTVVRLAQAAYEERHLPEGTLDNSRLAILADALEEAGCTDAEVLGHLRGPGPHVRGCWAVDLCLGKS